MNRILFIETCNYMDYPIGGHLAFAKQMITAYGNQLVLVGISTDNTPVGVWTKLCINKIEFDFFAFRKIEKNSNKPLIPERLKTLVAILKYRDRILSKGIDNIFIQTPDILFALPHHCKNQICYRIAGVENPLTISRYRFGKYLERLYDFYIYPALKKTKVILASADKTSIEEFLKKGKGVLSTDDVIQFPTRINTDLFKPISKESSRRLIKIDSNLTLVVTTGRLSELKGWKLMIEAFQKFHMEVPNSMFLFLGDGEDRGKIESFISNNDLSEKIKIIGRVSHEELAQYLDAADLYIMGSQLEGWSTSLVEAISCGKPVVCTNFSSAKELVENGYNGFIIENFDSVEFSMAMVKALGLDAENLLNKSIEMIKYSASNLKNSISTNWKLS
jgi:glycosyltransferase involved in cell wall biosynthesis